MILSMTGYGSGAAEKGDTAVSVEIRTVNHRFLDLHIRLPREYLFLESEIQQWIRNALKRGRVDVNAAIQKSGGAEYVINSSMVTSYLEAAAGLRNEFNIQDTLDLKTLLNLPGVLKNGDPIRGDDAEDLSNLMKQCVETALAGVLQMRRREGEALRIDMLQNIARIEESAQRIRMLSANSASECLNKLNDRLSQLLPKGGIDPQRLAQEAALIADKCDISEEVARLESHIEQYRVLIGSEEKVGKKLDFLLQELQREANTILSKSANMEIAHYAIAIKTDVEKLREQVQNVE